MQRSLVSPTLFVVVAPTGRSVPAGAHLPRPMPDLVRIGHERRAGFQAAQAGDVTSKPVKRKMEAFGGSGGKSA